MSGCSSVVEHNLAKVGVEGSNPFARSSPSRDDIMRKFAASAEGGYMRLSDAAIAQVG
jgi:hypothetical protein